MAHRISISTTMPTFCSPHTQLLRRYYEDERRMARKMDVLVGMEHAINLEHLRAHGPQPDERMQPSSASGSGGAAAAAPAAPAAPQADADIVANLAAVLGESFTQNAFQRAALAVGNSDANAAMNWLLGHAEDPDINDPPATPAAPGSAAAAPSAAAGGGADGEALAQIQEMGFTAKQARAALKAGGGGAERAVAWLFEQGEGLDAEVDRITAQLDAVAAPQEPKARC